MYISQLPGPYRLFNNMTKSIAIIGGGTGGLGTLKAILDLPEDIRREWRIDLYDQRDGIGGIWWVSRRFRNSL